MDPPGWSSAGALGSALEGGGWVGVRVPVSPKDAPEGAEREGRSMSQRAGASTPLARQDLALKWGVTCARGWVLQCGAQGSTDAGREAGEGGQPLPGTPSPSPSPAGRGASGSSRSSRSSRP